MKKFAMNFDSEFPLCATPGSFLQLPTLYVDDKNGKKRQWTVFYSRDSTFKEYGIVNMKITRTEARAFEQKNIGKTNETSTAEQARKEAYSDWVGKIVDGAVVSPLATSSERMLYDTTRQNLALSGNKKQGLYESIFFKMSLTARSPGKAPASTAAVEGIIKNVSTPDNYLPMLCDKWTTESKCMKYFDPKDGVYVQPKYDGIRCIAYKSHETGEVILVSRGSKQFPFLNHIRTDLNHIFSVFPHAVFDFELYAEVLYAEKNGTKYIPSTKELPRNKNFDVISAMCRPGRKDAHPLELQLSAYIFDLVDSTSDQETRYTLLRKIASSEAWARTKSLVLSETILLRADDYVSLQNDVSLQHDFFAQRGFEGIIIRARRALYEPDKRSLYVRKHKHFTEAEYKILGAEKDPGVGDEHFTWVCETAKGKKFNVKAMGTIEERTDAYQHANRYLGFPLTVIYQELTNDGVPRFPRGKMVRLDM